MYWYWGILFNEGWSFIQRSPLNVVVAGKILHGSRVGTVPCSSDIGCIQKVGRGGGGWEAFTLTSDICTMSEQIFCKTMGSGQQMKKKQVLCSSSIKIFTTNGGGSSTIELVAAPKISCKECNGIN